MSKVALLTKAQHIKLYRYVLPDGTILSPTARESGDIFISEEEIEQCIGITELAWLQDLTLIDFEDLTPPNTTPPQMTGYGLMIPQAAVDAELFENNQFEMSGFVINFTPINGGLAIDLAYLNWDEFRQEQLKPINITTKKTFTKLWDSVAADYIFSLQNPSQSKIIQL